MKVSKEMTPNEHLFLKRAVSELPATYETPAQYMYLANVYAAIQRKTIFEIETNSPR